MRVLHLAYVLGLGAALGLGSAYAALGGRFPFEAVRIGPWTAWPRTGSQAIDPYARGILARSAYLPLGVGEGLALVAMGDDDGHAFDSRCRYRLSGLVPPTRGWTMTLASGAALAGEVSGLTDADIVRGEDGRMAVTLSAGISGGNWLRMPPSGRIFLTLRLYDTPVSSTAGELNRAMLPAIQRLGCTGS